MEYCSGPSLEAIEASYSLLSIKPSYRRELYYQLTNYMLTLESVVTKFNKTIDKASDRCVLIPMNPRLDKLTSIIKSEISDVCNVESETGVEPPMFLIKIVDEHIKMFDKELDITIMTILN